LKKKNNLQAEIDDHLKVIGLLEKQNKIIHHVIKIITSKLRNGGKLMFCGNGGSAADAQHLVAELLIRLKPKNNRKPIPALSLATDTSTLTACGNDYDFDSIFSRSFDGLANKKDVLFAISTSGNSRNIIKVLKTSAKKNITSIALLGNGGGKAVKNCKYSIIVDSKNTARIQEAHIFLGHYILDKVEEALIYKNR
jgi:D-sedoheptulose 7-phosphate isomerase